MKITLEHATAKTGIFKSAPVIRLTVVFSDTEHEIIKHSGLGPKIFYEAPLHNHFPERMQAPTPVKYLTEGKCLTFHFQDEATARVEEGNIKESLKTLKQAIEANSTPVEKSQSFEL
jgi:hypothetical protein